MNKALLILYILFLIISIQLSAQVDTIYVNINANGSNNGTSWVDAYNNLNDALEKVQYGDEVWVAKGIYSPKDSSPFEIHKSIKLYGGFKGYESNITQRDWKLNETILDRGNSSYLGYRSNILYITNTDTTQLIDGFIIQKGLASIKINYEPGSNDTINCENNPYKHRGCEGGGIFMESLSIDKPVFLNLYNSILRDNWANSGGALAIDATNGIGGINIENCEFYNNKGSEYAGCIYIVLGKLKQFITRIINSSFVNNGAYWGVGNLYYSSLSDASKLLIENSKFISNSVYRGDCGALQCFNQNKSGNIIKNCLFKSNYCGNSMLDPGSGGAYKGDYSHFINCRFSQNYVWQRGGAISGGSNIFENCIFDHNYSNSLGGAICLSAYKNPEPTILLNCSFHKNQSGNKGGVIYQDYDQKLKVYNSIFSENKAKLSSNTIHSLYYDNYPEILIENNMIDEVFLDSLVISENGFKLIKDSSNINIVIDTSTIILDSPIFWDTSIGDYRIANCSKAIDAGSYKWTNEYALTTDYRNGSRVKGKNPDLGAYEMDRFLSFDTLITNATTKNTKDGAIQLYNFKGFKPPLDFTWSNGKKDSSIANLLPGVYLVYIEDSLKCHNTYSLTVESPNQTKSTESLTSILISPNLTNIHSTKPVLSLNSNKTQQLKLSLTNNEGKLLKLEQWNIQAGINSRNLPNDIPGIYYVALENEEYERVVLKYIVD